MQKLEDLVNKIHCEDCSKFLKEIPYQSIDLTVTSPPYDSMRDYNGYNFSLTKILPELFRVTKEGGVVVWIVGDQTINGSETGTSFRQAIAFMQRGFKLHDTMIYEKTNFSNPSVNRYHQIFEYMFIFSKGSPKTFNPIKDKKIKYHTNWGKNSYRDKNGEIIECAKTTTFSEFGMRNNIWRINCAKGFSTKQNDAFQHPAIFPEKLVEDHILSWSEKHNVILDPMCGSGTTCRMAKKHSREYIGIDISEDYCELSRKLIKNQYRSLI